MVTNCVEQDSVDRDASGSANCLAPGVQVGEYRLLGAIGEGGFGIVYRALDLTLDRIVAIKEYMPSTLAGRKATNQIHVRSQHRGAFDAGLRSFINEARLLAKFSHPALVHVYRFFEENGTAYMVMRHYEGQTLREFLESHAGSVSQPWLEAMLSPILDVLEMLHAADCYHRDIAPDNIFLQDNGVPVLLDFGAARRIIGDMTQALTMVLKPGFAPIEQYVEDGAMPQGAWTDVYQIGAVIYLAITGKPPATSVARMINDPMPTLGEHNYPGYSARFYAGVQRALAVKPQDRLQTIAELKSHLGIASFSSPAIEPRINSGFAPLATAVASPRMTPASTSPTALSTMKTVPRFSERAEAPLPSPGGTDAPAKALAVSGAAASQVTAQPAQAQVDTAAPSLRSHHKAMVMLVGVALTVMAAAWWGLRAGQAPSPPKSTELEEALSWQAAVQQPNRQNLEAYRNAFPNGKFREQAEALLLGLQSTESARPSTPEPATDAPQAVPDHEARRTEAARVALGAGTLTTPAVAAAVPPEVKRPAASTPSATGSPVPRTVASGAAAVPGEAAASSPLSASAKTQVRPGDAANQGQLLLRIAPWGRVSVDHAPMGVSPPLTRLDLSEGQHRVDISNPASKVPVTRTIWVKKGEPVVLDHQFE